MGDKKPYNYFGCKEGKEKEEKNGQEKEGKGREGGGEEFLLCVVVIGKKVEKRKGRKLFSLFGSSPHTTKQ
jgi:hypothetical protein